MAMWFFTGLAVGVMLTIPLIVVAARRTERRVRQLEQRARSAERLAELGTLTGGLAHEIKNPLSSVNLNIQLLQEDLGELSRQSPAGAAGGDRIGRISRRFDALAREVRRLRDILEDFLRFAGRMQLDRKPTDINTLVDELIDFFSPQADASAVTLRTQLAGDAPAVEADAALLKQAVLNLMINGCQAMVETRGSGAPSGGDGELIIRTVVAGRGEDRRVEVHVIDTGPGVPPGQVQRIFQPYVSTKKGGTGLGLPTARRIVDEHGGTLSVVSQPGHGSDFIISLPAPARPAEHADSTGAAAPTPPDRATRG